MALKSRISATFRTRPRRSWTSLVLEQYREERQRRDGPRRHDGHAAARRLPPVDEPRQPRHDEHREEQHEVAIRQRLDHPRRAEDHEPSLRPRGQVRVKAEQRERHPLRREDLEVRDLAGAVRREAEREPGADAGERRARQPTSEKKGEEPRERVRQQEADVVGGDRVDAGPLQRRSHEAQSEEMLRQRHRVRHWPHHRRVPPRVSQGRHLSIPPEDPGDQDRITRIVGNPRGDGASDRPRPDDRERAESEEGP